MQSWKLGGSKSEYFVVELHGAVRGVDHAGAIPLDVLRVFQFTNVVFQYLFISFGSEIFAKVCLFY